MYRVYDTCTEYRINVQSTGYMYRVHLQSAIYRYSAGYGHFEYRIRGTEYKI